MAIKLSKDVEKRLVASIKRYFAENMEDEIGDLKAGLLLDYPACGRSGRAFTTRRSRTPKLTCRSGSPSSIARATGQSSATGRIDGGSVAGSHEPRSGGAILPVAIFFRDATGFTPIQQCLDRTRDLTTPPRPNL